MTGGRLFESIRIGSVTLGNRIVFAPATTGYEEGGRITAKSLAFYRRIARGGAGLVVVGDLSPQPSFTQTPHAWDDRFVEGLAALAQVIHEEGARASAQLMFQEYDVPGTGRVAAAKGRAAAMDYRAESLEDYCNQLSIREIEGILGLLGDAARRVARAGFDMIQVNGDHLIGMFSSARFNRRTDRYGGSAEGRGRFAEDVVRVIGEAAPGLPIDYKLTIVRTDPPMGKAGPDLPAALALVPRLEAAGVDAFHVALANHDDPGLIIPPMGTQPEGCFLDLAEAVKAEATVPVTAVGRILRPEYAEEILQQGRADLIGLCRALLADPDWPLKARDGNPRDIRTCINCNFCVENLMHRRNLACATHAALEDLGEGEPPAAPGPPARLVVVGGGPAGLEAARAAAERGHEVVLFERRPALGGQIEAASRPPHKAEIRGVVEFLERRVRALGVDLRLGTAATADEVVALDPSLVILASGSRPARPPITGADGPRVFQARALLENPEIPEGRRAVVVGAGLVGLETAHLLAERGVSVTVVEALDQAGAEVFESMRGFLFSWLERLGVEIVTGCPVTAIEDGAVVARRSGGDVERFASDFTVLAVGVVPDDALAEQLAGRSLRVVRVGDCALDGAATLRHAIRSGYLAARAT